MSILKIAYPVFMLLVAVGCSNRVHTKVNADSYDQKTVAVEFASQRLNMSAKEVEARYVVRTEKRDFEVEYEFFSSDLVGNRDLELVESMYGGFPNYFRVTIDNSTKAVSESYMCDY